MMRFTWQLVAAAVVCAVAFTSAAQPTVPVAAPVPKDDGKARKADAVQRARSKNNLKDILLALHNYEGTTGHFPPDITDKNGKPLLSWRVQLLPYIEQEGLYKQFKLDEPWDSDNNKKLLAKMPDVFRVGFEPKDETRTYYQGFAGTGAFFEPGKKVRIGDITDGTSNTLAVAEAGPPVEWTKPADLEYDPKNPLPKLEGPFSNVLMTATADGAVHAFRRDIDEKSFRRLVEIADGQVIGVDDFYVKSPVTAEELEAAKKMISQNEKHLAAIVAELQEQQRLMLEIAKQANAKDAGKQLEEISKLHRDLKGSVEEMKKKTEKLKKQLEEAKKEPADPKK